MPIRPNPRASLSFTRGGTLVPRTPEAATPGVPAAPGAPPVAPATPAAPGTTPPLGGASGISTRPISPTDVQAGAPTLGDFQAHQDASLAQSRRTLDPMWEANKRRFDQDMINRGITPGSEAYDLALGQHDRGRNDAYSSAQNQAVEAGQRAQQQAFQQNYMESELANQLLRAREGNTSSMHIAGIGAGASNYGADIGRQNFMDQMNFNQQQAGTAADQWNRQFEQGGSQWDRQFGQGQQNSDFNQMMQMMGFDRDTLGMNNQNQNTQFNQLMSMFGMMPQAQGSAPIDYMGALNANQNQQNQNYATNTQNANQQNQNYMQIMSYFMCDEGMKVMGADVAPETCLEVVKGIPLQYFTYKTQPDVPCIGTTAQAFNNAVFGEPEPGGVKAIKALDMFGVMLGSLQALMARNEALEARIAAMESQPSAQQKIGPLAGFQQDQFPLEAFIRSQQAVQMPTPTADNPMCLTGAKGPMMFIATDVPGRHAPLLRPVESPA